MAVYVLEDRSSVIEFVPPQRPASATCSFKSPSGTELQAPTVTPDSTDTTIGATVTSSTQFQIGAAVVPGRAYWLVSSEAGAHESLIRCARYASGVAYLESPPPGNSVLTGDAVKGARLTASLSSAATATRDLNHRVEWTVTGADGVVRVYQQTVHVVRCLFDPAVSPDAASRYLSGAFPNMHHDRPWGYFAELARRSSTRVERKLLAGHRYQHLVGDSGVFGDAGIVALRIELALEGLVPPGFDTTNYVAKTEEDLSRAIQEAVAACWYDEDDDGVVNVDTERPGLFNVTAVRR